MPYKNKEDQAKSSRRHYEKNKDKYKARALRFTKQYGTRNRQYIRDYLLNHGCIDCGFDDIRALDFDHVRDMKDKNICIMVANGCSLKNIQEEIDKCEVRCANCHRIRHAEQRGSMM